jgi:hypothetical protein
MPRFVVPVSEDLHRKVRVQAAQEGRSIADIIRGYLEGYVQGAGLEQHYDVRLKDTGKTHLIETAIVKDPPTPAMTFRKTDAVSTKEQKPSTAKRPLPDFSKAAQVKGRMGR